MADKTVTVRPSGGTYTTLAAAITGEVAANANLTAAGMNGILTISIEGTWSSADTTAVNVTGFTTDATHYLVIDVLSNSYRLVVADVSLRARTNYMRIYGLNAENTTTTGSVIGLQASYVTIDRFIAKGGQYGIQFITNSNPYYYVINGEIYGYSQYGLYGSEDPHYAYIYNCTFAGGTHGCYARYGEVYNLKNCYLGNSSTADLVVISTGQINLTTTYTEDGTRSSPTAAYSTSTFTNVTSGSEDFSLATGSDLIGAGTDLSADATYPFDWDITGATRTTWDVGAAWFDAGGGGIVCAGIASTASIGTPAISATISASGITSTEAIGSPAISSTVYPSGIASTESIGSAALAATISASGIASAESVGQPTLSTTSGIVCAGIPSGETFGTPGLSVTISAAGIASIEAFGAPSLAANITATGIASSQAMGTPSIAASIMAASIASAEAVGQPSIGVELFLAGIASAESFGHPSLYTGGGMGEVVAGGAWRKATEAQTIVGGQWRTIAKVYAIIASEWTELS